MKLYFFPPPYPSARRVNYNPYSDKFRGLLKTKFRVVNSAESKSAIFNLVRHVFNFNVIVFNWIENISNKPLKGMQLCFFLLSFFIIKLRRVKVVWIMHNIHPHEGENLISHIVKKMMYRYSDLIIAHSNEAMLFGSKLAKNRVCFMHHPVDYKPLSLPSFDSKSFDVFIWGAIEPYKGVLEFVKFIVDRQLPWRVKIVGKCKSDDYQSRVSEIINNVSSISFENRRVSSDELEVFVQSSSFVIFPYLSTSVSSSGALMDTLTLGGNVIGPNRGAFKDLASEGLCFTFNTYDDIIKYIESNAKIDSYKAQQFLKENEWSVFAENVIQHINEL